MADVHNRTDVTLADLADSSWPQTIHDEHGRPRYASQIYRGADTMLVETLDRLIGTPGTFAQAVQQKRTEYLSIPHEGVLLKGRQVLWMIYQHLSTGGSEDCAGTHYHNIHALNWPGDQHT